MFGLFKGKKAEDATDPQEKMLIEVAVKRVDVCIQRIKGAVAAADAPEVEAISKVMLDLFKNPRLPDDKKREGQITVRDAERDVFVKACDNALTRAIEFAQADRFSQRDAEVRTAQEWLKKAIAAGASHDYRAQSQNKIQIIMETGGVKQKGPTAAKPLDINRTSNRVKG